MLDPVTTRYAEALFNLAKGRGVLDRVQKDVERLAAAMSNPEVVAFFLDARVSPETRREKLEPFLDGADELVRNFVGLLFDKRRAEVLKGLGAAFRRRALDEEDRAEGVVQSARPLPSEDVSRVAESLGRRLGKTIALENHVDLELLGGVRVIVENKMLDVSLRGRLDGLRERLLEAPLPAALET